MELSLILSIISIVMSSYIFLIKHYRELYRIGISNSKAFNNESGQMVVRISFVNESSTPLTVQGMLISDKEFRSYSTDFGELIDGISTKRFNKEINTRTVPFIVAPYSEVTDYFAFNCSAINNPNLFLEIETPKRFLVVPFNPIPDTYHFADTRKGRTREVVMHWKQNPIREFKDKIISFFEEKTWERWIYEAKLRLKRVLKKIRKSKK
ncbi:hypothetical protein [Streptococcus lutetiensis]|uniref:hypothetical protein n=1 Tax=Streptococcus lutetiensis TaxID=150055 RepID=UPI003562EF0C